MQAASCTHIADHTSKCGTAKTFEQVEHPFEFSEVLPASACSSAFLEDSRQRATPLKGSGIDRVRQATRNKLQHTLFGNTSTRVLISLNHLIPDASLTSSTPSTSIPNSAPNFLSQPTTSSPSQALPILSTSPLPTFSRAHLLLYRRLSSPETLVLTQGITLPFTCPLADNASHYKSRSRRSQHKTTPPITGAACPAKSFLKEPAAESSFGLLMAALLSFVGRKRSAVTIIQEFVCFHPTTHEHRLLEACRALLLKRAKSVPKPVLSTMQPAGAPDDGSPAGRFEAGGRAANYRGNGGRTPLLSLSISPQKPLSERRDGLGKTFCG